MLIFKFIYIIYIYIYIECNEKCNSCKGPDICLSCNSEYILEELTKNKELMCKKCEETEGLSTYTNNKSRVKECKEICGDGINLGEYECDDGNLVNGDGCSNECKVESGYICHEGGLNSPDVCKDIVIPTVKLIDFDQEKNIVYFIFSEPIFIPQEKEFITFAKLQIVGEYPEYIFDYELEFQNIKGEIVDNNATAYLYVKISLNLGSPIMDNDVIIYIYIYNRF